MVFHARIDQQHWGGVGLRTDPETLVAVVSGLSDASGHPDVLANPWALESLSLASSLPDNHVLPGVPGIRLDLAEILYRAQHHAQQGN